MNERIAQAAAAAQNELSEALARLNAARAAYDEQAGAQYAQHKADLAALDAKIEGAIAAQEEAEADFQREFAAAGFEKNTAVTAALWRNNDAQAMAEAMLAGRERAKAAMVDVALNASHQGRSYTTAYDSAQDAYACAQAYAAIQSAGPEIARALALVAHVPQEITLMEDFAGRPWPTARLAEGQRRERMKFVIDMLVDLARDRPEYSERPAFDGLGEIDLSAMPPSEFITPAHAHRMRCEQTLRAA